MRLDHISYLQYRAHPAEWSVEGFNLGPINLVVGRNSTGKSRVLNIIANLARRFLRGQECFHQGEYHVIFKKGEDNWDYTFEFDNYEVLREELVYNGENVLHRGTGGMGHIVAFSEDNEKRRMRFNAELKMLSVVQKRDSFQHPYLEPLHDWANSLRHFPFGTSMNPGNLALLVKDDKLIRIEKADERDTDSLPPILRAAIDEYKEPFVDLIKADMGLLGYPITDITIRRPETLVFHGVLPGEPHGVCVKEANLQSYTDQNEMSQGMFRSLSLLVQVNYYMMSNKSGCIVVDDIGEGLDFERSCILIDMIREKAKKSAFQLIMSTNNRFVMNRVPLEEWCFLERESNKVRVRNYANSATAFERFKRTGLNNFDLLATNYLQDK